MDCYIIGGAGSVGSIILPEISKPGRFDRVSVVDANETALFYIKREYGDRVGVINCDFVDLFEVVDSIPSGSVFVHAAASKHVGLCEQSPRAAILNNVTKLGKFFSQVRKTLNYGVYVSTDKAVEPTSVMGTTKRLAENIVLGASGWNVVRFGNIWGSRGSIGDVICSLVENAKDGDVIELPLRGGSGTRRFVMPPDVVCGIIGYAIESAVSGNSGRIIVPAKIAEYSVRQLISQAFNTIVNQTGKDVRLRLVDAPLGKGEKRREMFLSEEEAASAVLDGDYIYVRS